MWNDIVYEPGELKAVAYKDGVVIGESKVKTTGTLYELRLTPDCRKITAGGMDLSYILVEAFDKDGYPCSLSDHKIEIALKGPGRIAGVGNGNPQSKDPFQGKTIKLFYGKAMIIVGSEYKKGNVEITATADGLKKGVSCIIVE